MIEGVGGKRREDKEAKQERGKDESVGYILLFWREEQEGREDTSFGRAPREWTAQGGGGGGGRGGGGVTREDGRTGEVVGRVSVPRAGGE